MDMDARKVRHKRDSVLRWICDEQKGGLYTKKSV